jgi:Low-density lipoprotein receptor domain class A
MCDGVSHCLDNSDEMNCQSCASPAFNCGNGHCINSVLRCNGVDDCMDKSDEIGCICKETDFKCKAVNPSSSFDVHRCIPRNQLCDKIYQCPDGGDELNCTESETAALRKY